MIILYGVLYLLTVLIVKWVKPKSTWSEAIWISVVLLLITIVLT